MRRRLLNQMRAAGLLPPVSAQPAVEQTVPAPQERPAKGVCKRCGRLIGRGLHFHERSCDGNPR